MIDRLEELLNEIDWFLADIEDGNSVNLKDLSRLRGLIDNEREQFRITRKYDVE